MKTLSSFQSNSQSKKPNTRDSIEINPQGSPNPANG